MAPDAIINNSPALESLKHAQLRSLCSRHSVNSTGKKDVLINRLKALRTGEAVIETLEEQEPIPGSDSTFDIIDKEDLRSPQASEKESRPSTSTARVQTDEFGALSADAGTISKSSSLKSIVSKLFGGSSGSANSTITASTSTGSIASLANATFTEKTSANLLPNPSVSLEDRSAKSSAESILDPAFASAEPASAKPAYRIIDDSFANTTVYNDASFMPRRSFEDESIALTSAPSWPPRPGVVLVSPLQPSAKPVPSCLSPIGKRPLEEDALDDYDTEQDGYYPSIRKLPKSPNGFISPVASARKIAKPPRRSTINPNSPPRFDFDAPTLPSLAGVMAGMAAPVDAAFAGETSAQAGSLSKAEGPEATNHATFTFGSPVQKPHVFQVAPSATQPADGSAVAKQMEELQRRVALEDSSALVAGGPAGILKSPPQAAGGASLRPTVGMQRSGSVRFDDSHDKHFSKMDSISTHYAAKRTLPAFESNKRPKTDAPGSATASGMPRTVSSSSIAIINQQGRMAPIIPPRPEAPKTAAQQAEDRQRIFNLGPGSEATGSAHKPRIRPVAPGSARKAKGIDISRHRLPPSPAKVPVREEAENRPAVPLIPIKPITASSSVKDKLKNKLSSLVSMGSSNSLSSKSGNIPSSTSTGSLAAKATIVSLPESASLKNVGQYANSSLTRPTVASLAKVSQPIKRVPVPSEFGSSETATEQSASMTYGSNPFNGLSRSASTSLRPASYASRTSPPKKKVSSTSMAQRSSPMKSAAKDLETSIADARKIRARRDRQKSAQSAISEEGESGSSMAGASIGSLAGRGSINARPAWR